MPDAALHRRTGNTRDGIDSRLLGAYRSIAHQRGAGEAPGVRGGEAGVKRWLMQNRRAARKGGCRQDCLHNSSRSRTMNDQELDEILASLRDQPLPFESVREKVLARTRRKPWAWTLAAAALLLLTFATRPAWRVETRVETMPLPDVAQPKPPVFRSVQRPAAKRHSRPRVRSESMTVKLYTPDPDVVIYWLIEGE